jgi:hypothetical protein
MLMDESVKFERVCGAKVHRWYIVGSHGFHVWMLLPLQLQE